MRRNVWTVFFTFFFIVVMSVSLFGLGRAEHFYGPRAVYSPFQQEARTSESCHDAAASFASAWQDTVEEQKPKIEQVKKPGRAFFQSLLIPGWGQYYSGAKVRALIMFGLEATAVTYGLLSHKSGNDGEKDYKAFADDHWIEKRYIDDRNNPTPESWYGFWDEFFRENSPLINNQFHDSLQTILTHSLPETKNHEYYENIGKYDQFVYGWDDVALHGERVLYPDSLAPVPEMALLGDTTATHFTYTGQAATNHRNEYLEMRDKSNKAFKRAKTMVGIILFNHVISAIDGARSARNYNVKQAEVKTSLRMRMKKYEGEHIPQLVLTHRFY